MKQEEITSYEMFHSQYVKNRCKHAIALHKEFIDNPRNLTDDEMISLIVGAGYEISIVPEGDLPGKFKAITKKKHGVIWNPESQKFIVAVLKESLH